MSRMNANTEYASGAAKENTGHVIGSDNLKAKGRIEKERGNVEHDTAETHERQKGSKTGGQIHATKGAVKETVGSMLKNDSLEHSGARERRAGNQDIENAKTRNKAGGKKDQVKGTVKENTGHAVGNPQWEAEGRGEHIKGQARYNANQ